MDLEITWSYGEDHHFKGSHDGGSIKRKVYSDVSAQEVVIQDANHFAMYANVNILFLDKIEGQYQNVDDSSYIPRTLKIHHVKRVNDCNGDFYFNSQSKNHSEMLSQITYKSRENNFIKCSIDSENEVTNDYVPRAPQVGDVVVVNYETKKKALPYLGVVQLANQEETFHVHLKRSGEKTLSLKKGYIDDIGNTSIIEII